MRIYFFDQSGMYVGNRELKSEESVPINATTDMVEVPDGKIAYRRGGIWEFEDAPVYDLPTE